MKPSRSGTVAGQEFIALNGGPRFKFTEAVSFCVNCRTQAEIDSYWKKLSKGGEEGPWSGGDPELQ
jgi:predicted 3-demethylubiquinone-9 3-methyltransferase (glyoxalase superfamily)